MGETGRGNVCVEKIVSHVDVAVVTSVGNVTDEKRFNLGNGGHWNCQGNSGSVDLLINYLNFERRVASKDLVWGNFKSVQEGSSIDGSVEVGSEGE